MSARRTLLSRQQRNNASPQVQRPRQATALPPYEPPSCPLTENAKRSLANIGTDHNYRKYEKHLQTAIQNITSFAGESNDRVYASKEKVRRMAEKREAADDDAEKTEAEEIAEYRARELEQKVEKLTAESEKALRDLIDYKTELAQQSMMLKKVTEEAYAASAYAAGSTGARDSNRRSSRRPRNDLEDEDEDYEEPPYEQNVDMDGAAMDATILSPTELLNKAKEEYNSEYNSKTLRARYAEQNDYIGFKRIIHDARNPGENAPPVPHPSTWFPAETGSLPAARRRRLASSTDHIGNGDDEDDDIMMTGVVSSLKCPLTLQTFKEPYSNRVCKHTFEKSAILEFHRQNAVVFVDPSQEEGHRRGRGAPKGPKQLKCPERGCDAMLELKDFYDDQMILRQVKRQQAAENEELDETEVDIVPGTQRNRPQDIDSSSIIADTLRKRLKSEGIGRGHSRVPDVAEDGEEESEEDGDPEMIEMDD